MFRKEFTVRKMGLAGCNQRQGCYIQAVGNKPKDGRKVD